MGILQDQQAALILVVIVSLRRRTKAAIGCDTDKLFSRKHQSVRHLADYAPCRPQLASI
jgi:hypothetical protein